MDQIFSSEEIKNLENKVIQIFGQNCKSLNKTIKNESKKIKKLPQLTRNEKYSEETLSLFLSEIPIDKSDYNKFAEANKFIEKYS